MRLWSVDSNGEIEKVEGEEEPQDWTLPEPEDLVIVALDEPSMEDYPSVLTDEFDVEGLA